MGGVLFLGVPPLSRGRAFRHFAFAPASSLARHFVPHSVQWPPSAWLHALTQQQTQFFLHFSDFCDIHVVTRIFILKILAIHLLSATSVWQFFL